MEWLRVLLPALLAATVTLILTPLVVRLALRLQAVDVPGGRKWHRGNKPTLGGLAIVGGIVVSTILSRLVLSGETPLAVTSNEILGLSLAVALVFTLGLLDDINRLSPFLKLLVQLLAASIVVAVGWQFTAVRLPWEGRFYLGALAPLLSVLWIVGVTNAINLLDGLDGLAAGVVAIISSSLLALAILQQRPQAVIITSCIAGACLGFLRHNWRPAKIFMGDSGSLTLGFLLATITLRSGVKASAAAAILVPILALGLPLFDTVLVALYRFLRGHRLLNRFARIFRADRKHLHHLLLETHSERSKVVLTLFGLATGFCLMALLVAASGSLGLGLALLGVEFVAVLFIRRSGLNAAARRLRDDRLRRLERPAGIDQPAPAAVARVAGGVEERVESAKSATR